MAAAASAAGILRLRRWLASMAVSVAFGLGGSWVLLAFHVGETMGPCLALEGSVWADDKCRHLMSYPSAVAAVSLLLMLWLWRRELKAEAEADAEAAAGARDGRPDTEQGLGLGPGRRRLRDSGSMAVGAIIVIYSFCVLVMILGAMVRHAGENLLLKDPADKGAAAQVESGFVISDVELLSYGFGHCFLFIPYMALRVRRIVREVWVGPRYWW